MNPSYFEEPKEVPEPAATKPHEHWAKEKKTPGWISAGVRSHLKLTELQQLTEAEFDKACTHVATIKLG